MRALLFVAGLALLLGGCDNTTASEQASSPEQQPSFSHEPLDPESTAVPSNPSSRELFNMDGKARLAMFRKFMLASGEQCDLVTGAVLRGGYKGIDMWRVACTDSGEWLVSIEPDSSTKILSCGVVEKLGDNCHAVWKQPTSK